MEGRRDAYARFDDLYRAYLDRLSRGGDGPDERAVAELRSYHEAAERMADRGAESVGMTTVWPARPPAWELVAIALGLPRDPVTANPGPPARPPRVSKPGPSRKRLSKDVEEQLDEMLLLNEADSHEWPQSRIERELGISARQIRNYQERKKGRPGPP